MSSSGSALTRSRSTRKPSGKADKDDGERRNMSPSRLPIKGAANSAAGGTDRGSLRSVSSTSGTKSSAGGGSRPVSGVFGRPRQATTGSTQDAQPTTTTSRPPRTTRPPITRPASSTELPTASISRPTTSSGVPLSAAAPQRRVPSAHTRTKSSVTILTGATILRPPSQGSTESSYVSGTTLTTASGQTDRSRPPITVNTRAPTAAHRRQVSSASSSSSATTATRLATRRAPREQAPSQQPTHQAQQTSADASAPRLRPAFTTLQQHYSPAKSLAPKPLTATYLAPPSPSKLPANIAISAETARLQTELLQLHLIHRDATTVQAQWRESARKNMGKRFEELAGREQRISKEEEDLVERVNVRALLDWGKRQGAGLEHRVQILDGVLCGLWALGEPGGRYVRVVRRFEKWVGRVEQVWEVRKREDLSAILGEGTDDLGMVLVGELDAQWKDECAGLVRRLDEWRRSLKGLDTPGGEMTNEESSLVKILGACRTLTHDMLAELDLMEKMEQDVVLEEMRWVRDVNREMDCNGKDRNITRAGAIWRAL